MNETIAEKKYACPALPYQLAINGGSGNAAGDAPLSIVKLGLVLIALGWFVVLVNDPGTALQLPAWIVRGLWWTMARPFGG